MAVQFAVALFSAASVGLLFHLGWNPSITDAIERLAGTGEIRRGELHWTGPMPQRLGRGRFVALVIDPDGTGELGGTADVECVFTRVELRLRSLFGYAYLRYPERPVILLDRQELAPWWGAWRPVAYAAIGVMSVAGLFVIWWTLAFVYAFPVRLIAFYTDRELRWTGAWRLAAAALLPAALCLDLAILAYALNRLNLLQLLAAIAAHAFVGWIYVLMGSARLPKMQPARRRAVRPKNPFSGSNPT